MYFLKAQKKKLLYDFTYATRGHSGIPNDTRALARIFSEIFQENLDLLAFPSTYVKRRYFSKIGAIELADYLSATLKNNHGRSILPNPIVRVLIALQSQSLIRNIQLCKVPGEIASYATKSLGLETPKNFQGNLLVARLGFPSRFARSPKRKNFKIKTSNYNFYIQQHIDPISVSKKTTHIVRIHDILPITHPQFFDNLAIFIFSRGLKSLLKNKSIVWVFDSQATSLEFQQLFGTHRIVKFIPCSVGTQFRQIPTNPTKSENLISVVNTIEIRKNIYKVIEEFLEATTLGLIPKDYKLAILGSKGRVDDQLYNSLLLNKFGPSVEFIDSPSNILISEYLARSRIIVSASFAEGFGLPPLEGMLFGCIPVISDIPQHRETIREHGFYFNPEDSSLRDALKNAHLKSSNAKSVEILKIQTHVLTEFSEDRITQLWRSLLES